MFDDNSALFFFTLLIVVVDSFYASVQGVQGYETITGTTPVALQMSTHQLNVVQ